jgi:hypothetical protein
MVRLRSGKKTLEVACEHAGYAPARKPLKAVFNKRSRLQGLPGLLVDALSGAMWRFPDALTLTMRALDQAAVPEKAATKP